MIYLDYTANTPADPEVLDAYLAAERRYIANPNSTHIAGQEARAEMERVTQSIAQHLGVQPAEIIYTSGASEANNLALKGIAHASRHIGKHIISTQLEHSSVGASLSALQQQGYEIDLLDNPDGVKSADSYNRTLGYEEEYKVNKKENPTKSSIDNLLRKAKEQADHIVLWVDSDIPIGDLRDALNNRVRRSENIKSVTLVINGKDCTYTREQIVKEDFLIKQADLR